MTKSKIKEVAVLLALSSCTFVMADWPVAITDKVAFHPTQKWISIGVLSNDIGEGLYISSTNEWSENGGLVRSLYSRGGQQIVYEAPSNYDFVGEDGFWYDITDSEGRTNSVRVTVDVKPVSDDLPSPQEDIVYSPKNGAVYIDVLKNDLFTYDKGTSVTYADRGVIESFDVWSQNGGSIEKVAVYSDEHSLSSSFPDYYESQKYQLKYTPKSGFSGEDTFWYVVKDSQAEALGTQPQFTKVTINVSESETPSEPYPTTSPDSLSYQCASGIGCGINSVVHVLENDTGKDLKLKLESPWSQQGAKVAVVPNFPNKPYISYEALSNVTVKDKVWYVIEDAYGRQNWGVLNIN